MIALSLLFNKLAGFYGILALITGFSLSLFQLSMYIYSLLALVLLAVLMPHISKGSPLQNLGLAYFYLIDTLLNTIYTAVFAGSWFFTLSAVAKDAEAQTPGAATINATAGFTKPDVAAEIGGAPSANGDPSLANGVAFTESVPSILLIVLFTLVRLYFTLILFSYARQVLRQYVSTKSSQRTSLHMEGVDDEAGPFAEGSSLGSGWRGKLGRGMTSVGKDWWLGGNKDDEEWARNANQRFVNKELPGTMQREQRARSGTGPPPMRIKTNGQV